ncbi:MAG: helix-turn-helix domain-containing protein, partial [Aquihabitans sp.]
MAVTGLVIGEEDRETLVSWSRSRSIRASHVERARIVLAVADGAGTSGAARQLGVSRPTVIKWRDRFAEHGLAGLEDEPRPGRPKRVDDSAIIAATLDPPPQRLAVTHWS